LYPIRCYEITHARKYSEPLCACPRLAVLHIRARGGARRSEPTRDHCGL